MSGELQYVIGGRIPWNGVWLNRHYLARELARRERVLWVLDPLPTRPGARARSRRNLERHDIGGEAPPGVSTFRLPEFPLQRLAPVRRWNDRWSARGVRRRLEGGVPAVIVLLPRARLFPAGEFAEAFTVYLCSDDFRFFEDGSRDDAFCEWEERALAASDLVVAVSTALAEGLRSRHGRVRVVQNGFDPALFRPGTVPEPAAVADLPRPRIGYVGSVRSPLIDLDLAARVADARPAWSFVFIGFADPDDPHLAALRARANVRILDPRPRAELSAFIRAMDVMTCPYPKARVTEAASPLKAWEAIACGRPLVATHIPALDAHRPFLRSADSEEAYIAALDEVISDPPSGTAEHARRFTWEARAAELRGHIEEALRADRTKGGSP